MKTRFAAFVAAIVAALVSLDSGSQALAQAGTWSTIAPLPIPVTGPVAVGMGGKFYVIDGAVGGSIQAPQVYDPRSNTWSLKRVDPAGRAEAAAGVIQNKIYVAEGWISSDSNRSTTQLFIYDPMTNIWTAGASSLVARGESAAAAIGTKLYITGGNAAFINGDIATLEIYDSVTNTWSTGTPMPIAIESAVGAAINGKFYVAGGFVRPPGGGMGAPSAALYIYDPVSDSWTSGASMPAARTTASGGVVNGRFYVTGGSSTTGTDNPLVIYDPRSNRWLTSAPEPTPRFLGAAAGVGPQLFVAGGYNDNVPTSIAEVFAR